MLLFAAEERGCERTARDVAHLQAHETREARQCWSRTCASAQVPARHICVSLRNAFNV